MNPNNGSKDVAWLEERRQAPDREGRPPLRYEDPRRNPFKATPDEIAQFKHWRRKGWSVTQAAAKIGRSRSWGYTVENRELTRTVAAAKGTVGMRDAYDLIIHMTADDHVKGRVILDRYCDDEAWWTLALNLAVAGARLAQVAAVFFNQGPESEAAKGGEPFEAAALAGCERDVHLEELQSQEPA